MATHSGILARRISMDRGTRYAIVRPQRVGSKKSVTTEHTHKYIQYMKEFKKSNNKKMKTI